MPYCQVESQVRQARPCDTHGIINLLMKSFSPPLLRYSIYRSPGAENYLQDCLTFSSPGWGFFVIKQDDEVVGTYIAQERSEGWFLNYIAVSPRAESHGLGGYLLKHFEQEGRYRGIKNVLLDVFEINSRAIKWYYSKGYELIRRSFFIAISIHEATILKGPKLVIDDKEWRSALEKEKRQGFSNIYGLCHQKRLNVGLIAGDTLRLISWQGLSLKEVTGAIAKHFNKVRKELVILNLPYLPSGLPLISQDAVLRLSKQFISCKNNPW